MTVLDHDTRVRLRTNNIYDELGCREVLMEPLDTQLTWHEPAITPQVAAKIYDATSFLTWQYGLHFNAHLNIGFGTMGLHDRAAAAAMAKFNKEMNRYLSIADAGPHRRGGRRRSGTHHHYVYVLEQGTKRGLHAHMLCVIPPGQGRAVEAHAKQWWAREAGLTVPCARCRYPEQQLPSQPELRPYTKAALEICPGLSGVRSCDRHGSDTIGENMPENAIHLVHRPTWAHQKAYERQVYWLRYILKTTKGGYCLNDEDGTRVPFEKILKLVLRSSAPTLPRSLPNRVCVSQMYGVSHSLASKSQRETNFKTRLSAGNFNEVYSGWEWESYQTRKAVKTLVL